MFQKFVDRMNSQIQYNSGNGKINAVPIIVYHNLTYSMKDYINQSSTITVPEFAREMKYLHDHGFKVLVLNQFGYDANNNIPYINNNPDADHSRIEPITTTAAAKCSACYRDENEARNHTLVNYS
jgi:hypothetical protein